MHGESLSEKEGATLLVTGVTGFIGSSLVARLLRDGKKIIALSRNDPRGDKTRAAVLSAAHTLGIELPPARLASNLEVVSGSVEAAAQALSDDLLSEVDTVWHLAANLTYNLASMSRCLDINVAATAGLYQLIAARAPHCRRFYYFSTAYCIGFPPSGALIPEELHPAPRDPNVYQLTKWCAEMSLRHLSLDRGLPITILRPSIVVGHSATGTYHGDPFGLYMFFYAAHKLFDLPGFHALHLAPETNGTINLIPIDVLVDNVTELERLGESGRGRFEVIHCTGTVVPAGMVGRAGQRATGIEVSFDGPHTAIDHMFEINVEENRLFAAHQFRFEQARLGAILGPRLRPVFIDEETLVRLIAAYMKRLDEEEGTLQVPALLRPFLPWISRTRGSFGPTVARLVAQRYGGRPAGDKRAA